MTRRIVLELDPESGDYAVGCPELPGCVSTGTTEEAAKTNIREAIRLYLEETPPQLEASAKIDRIAV